jgi:phosphotransferase system enzyme I (PtsI)
VERLNGTGVSPGLVAGPALLVTARAADVRFRVGEAGVERQLGRLAAAVDASRHQLEEIRERIAQVAGPETARLFDAQILLLDDPMLAPRASTLIRVDGINAEWALQRACDELAAVFD